MLKVIAMRATYIWHKQPGILKLRIYADFLLSVFIIMQCAAVDCTVIYNPVKLAFRSSLVEVT